MIAQQQQQQQAPGYMETQQNQHFDSDAMEPVKNLLRELVRRLEEEQNEETSHHDWCETEKATAAKSQTERETLLHSMQERVDGGTTTISQLKSEIIFLGEELERVAR